MNGLSEVMLPAGFRTNPLEPVAGSWSVCTSEKVWERGGKDVRELRGLTSRELLTISLFKPHLPLPVLFQLTCTVYLV